MDKIEQLKNLLAEMPEAVREEALDEFIKATKQVIGFAAYMEKVSST